MVAVGPYGIEQVDVMGALNALEAARSNRIRSMLLQRQMQAQERELETQRGVRAAIGRFTGTSGVPTTTPEAPTTGGMADAVNLYGGQTAPAIAAPATPDSAAAAPAPAAPAGHGDIGRLATELLAIDPEHAAPIVQAFRQMDETQFQAAQRRNQVLAREAYNLLQLPPDQRQAEFNRVAPSLISEGGVTRQQIAGFQVTDANLRHIIAQARDIEKLAEEARPNLRNVEAGAVVIDENNIDPATGRPRIVMESPYVRGADGTLYRRPDAPAATGGTGGARGVRNNNPGNLEDGPFARSQPGYQGSDGRFARFDTPENGQRAQEVLLRSNYLQRPTTVGAIIRRYAPERENGAASVENYTRYVEQRLGIQPGGQVTISDASRLASAMREFETGQRAPAARAPIRVASRADYDRLPSGADYIAPDGSHRRKP